MGWFNVSVLYSLPDYAWSSTHDMTEELLIGVFGKWSSCQPCCVWISTSPGLLIQMCACLQHAEVALDSCQNQIVHCSASDLHAQQTSSVPPFRLSDSTCWPAGKEKPAHQKLYLVTRTLAFFLPDEMATKADIDDREIATKGSRFCFFLLSTKNKTVFGGRRIKNTNTHKKRDGLGNRGFRMSHPPLRAVISPERDERWSLEQRSPLARIQSLAPAKQHHIPRSLSPSAALSFLPPLRRKQLRINLNLSKSPVAYRYFLELHQCDQHPHLWCLAAAYEDTEH